MLRNTANHLLVFCVLWMFLFTLPIVAQDATATSEAVLTDPAYINTVTVNDDLTVDITGELGDACTDLGEIEQDVDGTTITITVLTRRPADAMCAMQLQVFETTVELDPEAVNSGANTLIVNGTEYPISLPEPEGADQPAAATCDDLTPDAEQAKFENDHFCFLYPDNYVLTSNETLVLLSSRQRIGNRKIALVIEVLEVDDTITSLEELEVIVADTYPEQVITYEEAQLDELDAIVTDSITMRSGNSRHLYALRDGRLITLEVQPINDDSEDAIAELWTMITESWVFVGQ